MKTILFITLILVYSVANCMTYYVSPDGIDHANYGTIEKPFKSIQFGVNQLSFGDTLIIRSGRYEESIKIPQLTQNSDKTRTKIKNFENETVIIDGSDPLKPSWRKQGGNIYSAKINNDIWQFFANNEMQTSARWPNAKAWSAEMWDKDTSSIQQSKDSSDGLFIDAEGGEELRKVNKSFKDAIAVMNVGSWLSFARRITAHEPKSSSFSYDKIGNRYHHKIANGSAFIEASPACLDYPGEWFFDKDTKILSWIPPQKKHPSKFNIRGKTRVYGLTANDTHNVHIQGLKFYACTFKIMDCNNIIIENCDFLFPSYSKRMLKVIDKPQPTTFYGNNNALKNCTFKYADGTGLDFSGENGLIENCLFSQIDYGCVGGLHDCMVNVRNTKNLIFRQNTLNTGGNSVGVKGGSNGLFELNRVTNQGLMQHDGAAIQVDYDRTNGTIMQKNWIHDHIKFALRFDTPWLDATLYGTNGILRKNVIWNAKPIVPKGDAHFIYNNTAFSNDIVDIAIFSDKKHGGINEKTVTKNNAVNQLSGARSSLASVPGITFSNYVAKAGKPHNELSSYLVDPNQLDFRPKKNSPLIDAGTTNLINSEYHGLAPDIGAYEYGDTNYWMAGYKLAHASVPIPKSNSTNQSIDRELIFQQGYKAVRNEIFFGTKTSNMKKITSTDASHNIIKLSDFNITLKKASKYYWQVNTIRKNGQYITGPIWNYTTESF